MLDTNSLHPNTDDVEAEAAILDKRLAGKTIYVPDTLFGELFQSDNWRAYAVERLARLAPYVGQIYAATGVGSMLRKELKTGRPAWEFTSDHRTTADMKELLTTAFESPDEVKTRVASRPADTKAEMNERMEANVTLSPMADTLLSQLRQVFGVEQMQKACDDPSEIPVMMKHPKVVTLFRKGLIESIKLYEKNLDKRTRFNADLMNKKDCTFNRDFMARFIYTVKAHEERPFVNRKGRKILSDHNDKDIIVLGTFVDELYTDDTAEGDGGAQYVDEALRLCIRAAFPEAHWVRPSVYKFRRDN